MEYILVFLVIATVVWLLLKLVKIPPSSVQPEDRAQLKASTPGRVEKGRGLDALIPEAGQSDQPGEIHRAIPPPPEYSDEEILQLPEPVREEMYDPVPPPTAVQGLDDLSDWPGVEQAIDTFFDAGLLPDFEDKQALSAHIRDRMKAYDSFVDAAFWHRIQRSPLSGHHPWSDLFVFLALGSQARFVLHNAFRGGLTGAALLAFARSCRELCGEQINVETVEWNALQDGGYQLQVNDNEIEYAPGQALWTVPMKLVEWLNAGLPDQESRFEVISLLPIYGETFVFYLDESQKRTLETKRNWTFFEWSQLKGGQHA